MRVLPNQNKIHTLYKERKRCAWVLMVLVTNVQLVSFIKLLKTPHVGLIQGLISTAVAC